MEDKKNLTRKQILIAADECFTQHGYMKTTFNDVARRAGISRASLYLYFKNKAELFMTVREDEHLSLAQQSAAVLKTKLSDKAKLKKIIDIWIIDPYRIINRTPFPNSWLDQLKNVKESENLFRRNFIESLEPLLGRDVSELVVLSYRGLMDDRPSVKVLEKRTAVLINILMKSMEVKE